jgi:hypothetical protein
MMMASGAPQMFIISHYAGLNFLPAWANEQRLSLRAEDFAACWREYGPDERRSGGKQAQLQLKAIVSRAMTTPRRIAI